MFTEEGVRGMLERKGYYVVEVVLTWFRRLSIEALFLERTAIGIRGLCGYLNLLIGHCRTTKT